MAVIVTDAPVPIAVARPGVEFARLEVPIVTVHGAELDQKAFLLTSEVVLSLLVATAVNC